MNLTSKAKVNQISNIIYDELDARIGRIKREIDSASDCLANRDYMQCAVRLQSLSSEAQFDEITMRIMDSTSTALEGDQS